MPAHSASHLARINLQPDPEFWTVNDLHRVLDGAVGLQQEFARWLIPVVAREARIALQPIAFRYRRDLRDVVEEFVNDIMGDLFMQGGKMLRAWNPQLGMQLRGFIALIVRRTISRRFKKKPRELANRTGEAPHLQGHPAATARFRGNPWSVSPADVDELHALIDDGIAAKPSVLADVEYRIQLDWVLTTLFDKLNDRDWRLFTKLFIEQRSPADVAVEEEIGENSVHKWRSRFHVRVRKLLGQPETNPFASLAAPEDLAARVRSLFADGKLRFQQLLPPLLRHETEALLNRILPLPERAAQARQRFNEQPSSDGDSAGSRRQDDARVARPNRL